eukprot:1989471-Alexandrium_andersonii.AAC.1
MNQIAKVGHQFINRADAGLLQHEAARNFAEHPPQEAWQLVATIRNLWAKEGGWQEAWRHA